MLLWYHSRSSCFSSRTNACHLAFIKRGGCGEAMKWKNESQWVTEIYWSSNGKDGVKIFKLSQAERSSGPIPQIYNICRATRQDTYQKRNFTLIGFTKNTSITTGHMRVTVSSQFLATVSNPTYLLGFQVSLISHEFCPETWTIKLNQGIISSTD